MILNELKRNKIIKQLYVNFIGSIVLINNNYFIESMLLIRKLNKLIKQNKEFNNTI